MVWTEYEFSAAAARDGRRAAFLEYLGDDAIMFIPGPIKGKPRIAAGKNRPGLRRCAQLQPRRATRTGNRHVRAWTRHARVPNRQSIVSGRTHS
jgi:hypothetical protein